MAHLIFSGPRRPAARRRGLPSVSHRDGVGPALSPGRRTLARERWTLKLGPFLWDNRRGYWQNHIDDAMPWKRKRSGDETITLNQKGGGNKRRSGRWKAVGRSFDQARRLVIGNGREGQPGEVGRALGMKLHPVDAEISIWPLVLGDGCW
jgi:hypothetical protein